jgi:hypothetical protein
LRCLGGLGSKGAIFFHCASVSNGPDRAIGPPSALLTLLIPHFTKLNHSNFRGLSWVMQQLLQIEACSLQPTTGASRDCARITGNQEVTLSILRVRPPTFFATEGLRVCGRVQAKFTV